MEDETVSALREIAHLLRRRVEQHDEQVKRSEKRLAELGDVPAKFEMPDMSKFQEDSEKRVHELKQLADARRQEERQLREQEKQEERAFRERLLAEMERHNALLERLVEQRERRRGAAG